MLIPSLRLGPSAATSLSRSISMRRPELTCYRGALSMELRRFRAAQVHTSVTLVRTLWIHALTHQVLVVDLTYQLSLALCITLVTLSVQVGRATRPSTVQRYVARYHPLLDISHNPLQLKSGSLPATQCMHCDFGPLQTGDMASWYVRVLSEIR